jgi:hypothetical protein
LINKKDTNVHLRPLVSFFDWLLFICNISSHVVSNHNPTGVMLPISNGQTNLVASKGDGGCGLDCHSHYFASIGIDPRRHINGNDRGGGLLIAVMALA